MPSSDLTAWEGHSSMSGVDAKTHPSELLPTFATSAVNRTFRGGNNSTRPPIQSKNLVFETAADEEAFSHGNIAGAIGYRKIFKNTQPHLIVAAGPKILKGRMYGNSIEFSTLYDLRTPEYRHAWFAQGEDRLYYQNGVDDPVGWDGGNPAYAIEGGIENDKMPIGTNMAYIHGRLVVFEENNHALVSDFIYGNTVNSTAGLESFIEIQQFNDIGAIPAPALLGDVTGAIAIPRPGDKDGQGDLLVLCKDGAYVLKLTGVREQWLFGDIQQIVLQGVGGASVYSVLPANNDIWFRTAEGQISSYKFERSEEEKTWGDTSLSREVERYLALDSPRNLKYCSSIVAHNRLITSTALTIRKNDIEGYGHHRFGQGMVALDFDRGSTVNRKPGFAWDGLWTGVNPVQFATVEVDDEKRPLILSHDEDGQNRVYEFMPDGFSGSDMAEGRSKSIVSFYETPHLFKQRDPKNRIVGKSINGARAEVSDVDRKSTISVSFRAGYSPCWNSLGGEVAVGSEAPQLTEPLDQKKYHDTVRFGIDDRNICEPGTKRLATKSSFFAARVEVSGNMTINDLQLIAEVYNEPNRPSCNDADRDKGFSSQISCPEPDLFTYKIIDKDGNTGE